MFTLQLCCSWSRHGWAHRCFSPPLSPTQGSRWELAFTASAVPVTCDFGLDIFSPFSLSYPLFCHATKHLRSPHGLENEVNLFGMTLPIWLQVDCPDWSPALYRPPRPPRRHCLPLGTSVPSHSGLLVIPRGEHLPLPESCPLPRMPVVQSDHASVPLGSSLNVILFLNLLSVCTECFVHAIVAFLTFYYSKWFVSVAPVKKRWTS